MGDGTSSLEKQMVGISISDSNFNDNLYNDKPQQIPKIQQIKQRKHIIRTIEGSKNEIAKRKTQQQIKTKITKYHMEEAQSTPMTRKNSKV
jgi:hypothetical protein